MVLSMIVGQTLQSRFAKYSRQPLSSVLTGKEIAEKCCAIMEFMMSR